MSEETAKPKILFRFSREEVCSRDATRFLSLFGDEGFPSGEPLRLMQGAIYVAIEGYDDDPRALPEIAEARQLCQALYSQFPYWFYFFVPETLPTLALCLFKNYSGIRTDKTTMVAHQFKNDEMADFVKGQAAPLQEMCLRAGLTLRDFDRIYYELAVRCIPEMAKAVPPPQ
jgi:hypothetical protein